MPDLPEGAAHRRLYAADTDALVREEPLVLEIDGRTLLTMRTPGQERDLGLGFLLGEGLVRGVDEVVSVEFRRGVPLGEPGPGDGDGIKPDRLVIELVPGNEDERRDVFRREHEIRPSCGVCGLDDLGDLVPGGIAPGTPKLEAAMLERLLDAFRERQSLFAATGGAHAAAMCSVRGEVLGFGEDVGRHNALDKAIGQLYWSGHDASSCVALLSGRAGYELVAKCLRVRCPIIVAVSAASALAFDLSREAGATLLGFARDGRFRCYWDEGRIQQP
jgi:FdhD protein